VTPEVAELLTTLRRRTSMKWAGLQEPQDPIPAWVAEMDFEVATAIRSAVIDAVGASDLGYPDHHSPALREAVTTWTSREWDWSVEPQDVYVLADAVRGVEMSILALTSPGDPVIVLTPSYPPLLAAVTDHGRRLVQSELVRPHGRWQMDLEAVAEELDRGARMLVMSNPHNPTGVIFTPSELSELVRLAADHGAVVVSDEIHAPLTYRECGFLHRPTALSCASAPAHTVTVTSTSKAWNTPGLRCGLMIAQDRALRDALGGLPVKLHKGSSIVGIVAAIAAITEGGEWLRQVMETLQGNRRRVERFFTARGADIDYTSPEASYLAWFRRSAVDLSRESSLAAHIREAGGVVLNDGNDFGRGGAGWARLNFATPPALLDEILDRVGHALDTPAPAAG
jgi:cystathionine beta-lyase